MKCSKLGLVHCKYTTYIKDLNVRPESIKIIEENIGSKISDMDWTIFYQIYLPRQGKQKKKKNQTNKWPYMKLKSFCTAKENINKIKRQFVNFKKIFGIYD